MKQNGSPKNPKTICLGCYYNGDCIYKPTSENRCDLFLLKKKVEVSDNISVNPSDTIQLSYDDLKDLLKDLDI